ncbi:MAG: AAA family ATPase, partial [Candidatus Sericytochromatia bacterium]|nr:AAA family ATPase [Candidatus Tanganyikabacteria bacterium]
MGPLRILEIEIDNFKTFRHEVIPFLPGFTAISGPNGSGKSNILDALLWCLGLSSNRTLRAEKGTDLINNGSSRREARVTVRLGADGSDERIEVSRRIKESQPQAGGPPAANSTYYLNGRVASLTDIHDLLSLHHISPSGYNVVMQGDVTSIIRMTTSERRKIIDEVAGVAEFDHRIEQARKELQTVLEQEERTGLLLGELETRLGDLRHERDQALKYLALKEDLKRAELGARLAARWDLLDGIKGLQKVMEASAGSRAELEQARTRADGDLAEALALEAELAEKLRVEGGERLEELEAKVRAAWEAAETSKLQRQAALDRAAELTDQAAKDAASLDRHKESIAELAAKETEFARVRDGHEAAARRHEAERETLQAQVDELLAAQQDLKARITEIRERRDALYQQIHEMQVARMKIEAMQATVDNRLAKRKEERQAHLAQLRQAEAEARRLEDVAERARLATEAAREDEERSRLNVDNLTKALAQVEAQLVAAKQEFAVASQQLSAQEASMGQAVDTVLAAGIPGVIGTLLQLGEAEPEFARALQEAAGGRLRNIVVEDDGVAAKVSKLLHAKAVGRATCLPLNKLQPARKLAPVRAAGCLGYAIEKVQFDRRFEAAFFHAFGDTLIFASLDAARPHIGQYRMVTLEGDLLDKGGAMTVGRSRNEPAHFLANLRAAFEDRKAGVQAAGQRAAQHQQALDSMKQAALSAADRRREAEQAAHAADLDRQAALHAAREAAARLAEDDAALAADQAEVASLGDQVEQAIDAALPAEEEYNELEFRLGELQDEAGDERLAQLQDQAQQAAWAAGDAHAAARAAQTELAAALRSRQEAEKALEESRGARERKLREAAEATAEATELEGAHTRLATERQALEAERNKAKAGLEALSNARDAARERRHACERAVESRQQDLDRLADGLRHTSEKLAEQTGKLEEMETGLWEDGIEPPEGRPEMTTAQAEAARLEATARLEELGMVNQLAVEQFEREDARASELRAKQGALTVEREGIEVRIADISGQKKAVFMEAFEQISG